MSVYFIEGHLGAGKSLQAVGRLMHYARQGRRIAGNIDVKLPELCGQDYSQVHYVRISDMPTERDFEALGKGSESMAEDTFGAIVLDEGAVSLNARDWNDPKRKGIIRWLVHARKLRWDVFILIQSVDALDSQIKSLLLEYRVMCYRLDKINVPGIGWISRLIFGKAPKLPKMFVGTVFYGRMAQPIKADQWWTKGADIWKCYDTEQALLSEESAPYSLLSPWHTVGRYLPPRDTPWQYIVKQLRPLYLWPCRLVMAPVVLLGLHVRKVSSPYRPPRFESHPQGLPPDLGPYLKYIYAAPGTAPRRFLTPPLIPNNVRA